MSSQSSQSIIESQTQSRSSFRSQSFAQASELNQSIKSSLFNPNTPQDLMLPKATFVEEQEFKKDLTCYVCKIPFGQLKDRQHHCRMCGNSCCNRCSTRTINKQRACDVCFLRATQMSFEKKRNQFINNMKENIRKVKNHISAGQGKLEQLQEDIKQQEQQALKELEAVQTETAKYQSQYTTLAQEKQIAEERIASLKQLLEEEKIRREQLINQEMETDNSIRAQDTEVYLKEQALSDKRQQLYKLRKTMEDLQNSESFADVQQEYIQQKTVKNDPNVRAQSLYNINATDDIDSMMGINVALSTPSEQPNKQPVQQDKEVKGCGCQIF